ncbi:unnamed protein product [Effrenium voratum]|uniref:PrpF protein n=1 Tax=Effrenium voratum TaxID=2562239 RepID=A0AA36MPZ3_9DINO|nr:unnamed protein product [Effrenium voratum]
MSLLRVPFAFYRSGSSRGLFLQEEHVPARGAARERLLCKLMGSGVPGQVSGFGGLTGPTNKVMIVGRHSQSGWVTMDFNQVAVDVPKVDFSHGDCGNMLAAVGPFALEQGLVEPEINGQKATVRIHSANTGACYEAEVALNKHGVEYQGDTAVPGVPGTFAPVHLAAVGVAGSQTGALLPTGRSVDLLEADGLHWEATLVDFARALVVLDANAVLPAFGYSELTEITLEVARNDPKLCAALEAARRQASKAMGMGDCAGNSPKLALVAPTTEANSLACCYFVAPERQEMHPTIAMTAAQALGAACLLEGSVAWKALGKTPEINGDRFELLIHHPQGAFPVSIGIRPAECHFPLGVPDTGRYTTTVWPIADGVAFVDGDDD